MKRKKPPLERFEGTDAAARAKVALVLEVLAGTSSITQACREAGLNAMQYYKLEERLVGAMLEAASMPAARGRRMSAAAAATRLAEETEALKQEHRRMKSLVRVSRKLFRPKGRKGGKRGPGRPKKGTAPQGASKPQPEAPKRPRRLEATLAPEPVSKEE